MGEKKDSDELARIRVGVDPTTGGVSGEAVISKDVPGLIGRMAPVKWMGKRNVERAIYERFVKRIRDGGGFSPEEAALAVDMLTDHGAKYIRLNTVGERARVLVEERTAAGEIPRLPPTTAATETTPSPDWENRFREDASLVDEETVREIYARVLAEESLQPGAISKRTLGVLRDLDRKAAESFQKLTGVLIDGDLVQRTKGSAKQHVYELVGLDYEALLDLAGAGLINLTGANQQRGPARKIAFRLTGQSKVCALWRRDNARLTIEVSAFVLSPAGRELAQVLPIQPNDEVTDALLAGIAAHDLGSSVHVAELPWPGWDGDWEEIPWEEWKAPE